MRWLAAIGVFLVAMISLAQAECYLPQVNDSNSELLIGTVTAKRSVFHDEESKPTKAYVLQNDEIIALAPEEGWVCATYIGKNGVDTSGYLKAADVKLRPQAPPAYKDWLGDWTTGKWQNITLSKGKTEGFIDVSGSAYWAMSEETAQNGGLNSGGIYSEAPIVNNVLSFTQTQDGEYKPYAEASAENYDCAVLATLLSRNYLMVEDTGNCGGHNVRFTGLYGRGKVDEFME